jgi:signal transduction histidine kinase
MKKKILIVDDEQDIREVLSVALADMGYDVVSAENGEEALALFQHSRPPVVLTDIKMPRLDGLDLLQKIKHENPETEVIMITGHGDMDLAVKSLKYEATDFITKPINVDALEISLRRAEERILTRQKLKEYTENLERLIREKTELQSHLSSLGLMIASISHGIKGLLTGLDGAIYLVNSGFAKNDPQQVNEGWETVKLMVERIRSLMLDILFCAKERKPKREPLQAVQFAQEVARSVAPKIQEQQIEFLAEIDETVNSFAGDPGYLHSALGIILENAVDACVKDPTAKPHKIIFGLRQDRDHIVFDIFDNGIGMDSETKEKIFDLFFSAKGEKGTGLGLFICQKIIEQHGGTIDVKSTPGHGSLFTVKIPKCRPGHPAKET